MINKAWKWKLQKYAILAKLTKICNTCKINKKITEYGIRKGTLDGHNYKCKECDAIYKREHYLKHQDRYLKEKKIYREENKDKLNKQSMELYYKNRDRYNISKKIYREKHKDKFSKLSKQYYIDNKERIVKQKKEFYENNKERMNLISKNNYIKNRKYYNESSKKYRKDNPLRCSRLKKEWSQTIDGKLSKKTNNHKRNSKIRTTNDKTITIKSLNNLLEEQNNKCKYCNIDLDFNVKFQVHLDHIVPIAKGGQHSIKNVVFSCKRCNLKKSDKIIN